MAIQRCCYLKLNGARCSMPAVNGKDFCFAHETRRRRARSKPCPPPTTNWTSAPLVSFVYMEDIDSVLECLNATADAFARHMIDHRQVNAVNRLCETAFRMLQAKKKLSDSVSAAEAVREVRYDDDGAPMAFPDSEQPGPAVAEPPAESSAASAPEPVVVPVISACAEVSGSQPCPFPPSFQTLVRNMKLTRFYSTHTEQINCKSSIFKQMYFKKQKRALHSQVERLWLDRSIVRWRGPGVPAMVRA